MIYIWFINQTYARLLDWLLCLRLFPFLLSDKSWRRKKAIQKSLVKKTKYKSMQIEKFFSLWKLCFSSLNLNIRICVRCDVLPKFIVSAAVKHMRIQLVVYEFIRAGALARVHSIDMEIYFSIVFLVLHILGKVKVGHFGTLEYQEAMELVSSKLRCE